MARLKHSGGIVEATLDLGFDAVKYFEIAVTGSPQMLTVTPPARRLTLKNTSTSDSIYFNITGDNASTSVGAVPGDNIKIPAGCAFDMDFDTLTNISFVSSGASIIVEGILGWKGTGG